MTNPSQRMSLVEKIRKAISVLAIDEAYASQPPHAQEAEVALRALCAALGCSQEVLEGVASGENVIVRRDNILRLPECNFKVIELSSPPTEKTNGY